MKLFNTDRQLSLAFKKLLNYFSINSTQSLPQLVDFTQKAWLVSGRKQSQRNQTLLSPELKSIFTDLGMVNAQYPKQQQYDYILLLGSDVPDMRDRLAFLNDLIKKGVCASKIVVLCSDRPLYDYERKFTSARTECQMAYELISKMDQIKWPIVEYCHAYGKTDADGTHQRATTDDTVKAWLATKPKSGNCLVISQQPYIGRQHAVMQTYLKNSWTIETVGPQLATDFTLEDMLDTLARWLYQEYKKSTVL